MCKEKVCETLKIFLFYGINGKDKVDGQQSNAILLFIYLLVSFFAFSNEH